MFQLLGKCPLGSSSLQVQGPGWGTGGGRQVGSLGRAGAAQGAEEGTTARGKVARRPGTDGGLPHLGPGTPPSRGSYKTPPGRLLWKAHVIQAIAACNCRVRDVQGVFHLWMLGEASVQLAFWSTAPPPPGEQVLAEVWGSGVGVWAVTSGTRIELPRLSCCGREDTHVTRLETAPCPPHLCSMNTALRVKTINRLFRAGQPPALGNGS